MYVESLRIQSSLEKTHFFQKIHGMCCYLRTEVTDGLAPSGWNTDQLEANEEIRVKVEAGLRGEPAIFRDVYKC